MMTVLRKSERGQVLLAAMILALVLGLTCGAMVIVSVGNSTASLNNLQRTQALTVAEVGVEFAKAKIVADTYDQQFAAQDHEAVESGIFQTPDGGSYGSYNLHVTEEYGDVEDQYRVISMGTVGLQSRQVEVVIRRGPTELPQFLAAINLYNPNALARFCGMPPRVCGLDTDIPDGIAFSSLKDSDCTPGSGDGPDVVGVGVHDDGSVTDIIDELGSNPERITGTDGAGGTEEASVYNLASPNPTGQVDTMTAADIAGDSSGNPTAEGNFGTLSQPRIVVIEGATKTVKLTGCVIGSGLLIIDCDVEFGGTFNYAGLILITNRGNATVSVELQGTPLVLGSIVAANPGDEATSVLDLRGTADVFFSRQGLSLADQALSRNARFVTKYYGEKKPDAQTFEIN